MADNDIFLTDNLVAKFNCESSFKPGSVLDLELR